MATRLADTLLAADADMDRIHRRVVRVGAAAAWSAAALFMVLGFLSGESAMFVEAVGPVIAASFMTTQILLKRENGGMALFSAALITLVMYAVVGNEATLVPAAVALVLICSIGMLLIDSHQIATVGSIALVLVISPLLWGLPVTDALTLGAVMALGFIMASAIFFTVRNAAAALNVRFQTLFESSPTAVMEEDWSEALAYVRSEYTGRPDRIRPFLMAYPAVVARAVGKAKITRANQAAIDLLEASDAEHLLGYRDPESVTDETVGAFALALATLYEGGKSYEQEVFALTMEGRPIWLQTRCVDTSSNQPATTILVGLADVTHMQARQDAMAELVRAKDEFIAKVSHELRTPLTAVVGLTSEMAAMDLSEEEQAELMLLVCGQASEMSYIVDDLLVAARAEMETMALDTAVVDMGVELRKTIDGLGITVQGVADPIPAVVADASRVRQILRNLLTNADRYGGPNRRITAGAALDRAWLEVRDDGEGVDPSAAEVIFEPYSTAHSGVTGSVGLGLSVARQLAELMGGSLTYHRDPDETVFRLELPIAGASNRAQASVTASV
ncbi:MAG: HAMP domain-containing sensor histidine kinase [Actinomycetota bacterium]|nr:HAMP domain-containing sensor histidine kinase [Actinomycetota bacterium]